METHLTCPQKGQLLAVCTQVDIGDTCPGSCPVAAPSLPRHSPGRRPLTQGPRQPLRNAGQHPPGATCGRQAAPSTARLASPAASAHPAPPCKGLAALPAPVTPEGKAHGRPWPGLCPPGQQGPGGRGRRGCSGRGSLPPAAGRLSPRVRLFLKFWRGSGSTGAQLLSARSRCSGSGGGGRRCGVPGTGDAPGSRGGLVWVWGSPPSPPYGED